MSTRNKKWISLLAAFCVCFSMFAALSITVEAKAPAGGVVTGKVYRFKNKGSGKYLNLSGGKDVDGRNINQFEDDGTDTLEYKFIEGTGDYEDAFKIQPVRSTTRVVDVQRKGQPIASGGNVQLWTANDDISQHFIFKDTGDGDKSVYICPYTNQDVYLSTYNSSNGTSTGKTETSSGNVFVKSLTGTNYQKWYVEETEANPKNITAGTYYIRNTNSDRYMGINSSNNVVQQTFNGSNTQQWVVSVDSSGYYTLKIKSNTNYRLDVDNAWDSNGTNIKVMTYTGYDAQLFRIIPNGDGTYRISPKHSTLRVVDVNGKSTVDGANIHLWNFEDGIQQKWVFEPYVAPLARYTITPNEALFISQLTDPEVSFNKTDEVAYDFEKAYRLLKHIQNNGVVNGKAFISKEELEAGGYCEEGSGWSAEALINTMYSYSLSGKTMLDKAMEDNAKWQTQLTITISFMYYNSVFNNRREITISDNTFSSNSRLDMIEKNLLQHGVSCNVKDGAFTAYKGARGSLLGLSNAEIVKLSRSQLQSKLPTGWSYHSNNGFIHIKSGNKTTRIRVDPADNSTPYIHMHIYDENGNPLDISGTVVDANDLQAHIPYFF